MARSRILRPGFFEDEDISELSFAARICFQGLWIIADRQGYLEYRPKKFKKDIFPYDNVDIEQLLLELSDKKPFIKIYEAEGKQWIWIPKFLEHQKPHPHEPILNCPRHPDDKYIYDNIQYQGSVVTCHDSPPALPENDPALQAFNSNFNSNSDHDSDQDFDKNTHMNAEPGASVCVFQKIPQEALESIKEAYLHREYIEKAVTYAKDLVKQCPNIASISWVESYLKNEFPLILDRRKDINPQQILNCWMDACDTCAGKQNFNTNLLKTIFLSKINEFNPEKPPKNHVSKPIVQQKPKWRRYLEDYAELEEIFPPQRVFKTCDLEAKEPLDPRCTLISELRDKNTDELINLDNLRPVKPDTS